MKTCKLLALMLAAMMLVGALVSCGGGGATTDVTLILQVDGDDAPMFDQVISVKGETITVGDVVEEATMSYGLTLGWTDLDALTMPDYPDHLNEDGTYDMWICLINGNEPKGRTRETEVKAGDKIVYTYTHYIPVEEE